MCCRAASGTPGAPAAVPLEEGVADGDVDVAVAELLTDVCDGVESQEAVPELVLCDAVDDAPPLEPPLQPAAASTARSVAVARMAGEFRIGDIPP
ncbi:hypothetical protein [Flexivirga lutea]